jgi:hypothetical protein
LLAKGLGIWHRNSTNHGESHSRPQGNYLVVNLSVEIEFQNFIIEEVNADVDERPNKDPKIIQTLYTQKKTQDTYPDLTFEEAKELTASIIKAMMLSATHNSYYIGRHNWRDTKEYERMQRTGSFKGSSLFLVGAAHTLSNVKNTG